MRWFRTERGSIIMLIDGRGHRTFKLVNSTEHTTTSLILFRIGDCFLWLFVTPSTANCEQFMRRVAPIVIKSRQNHAASGIRPSFFVPQNKTTKMGRRWSAIWSTRCFFFCFLKDECSNYINASPKRRWQSIKCFEVLLFASSRDTYHICLVSFSFFFISCELPAEPLSFMQSANDICAKSRAYGIPKFH